MKVFLNCSLKCLLENVAPDVQIWKLNYFNQLFLLLSTSHSVVFSQLRGQHLQSLKILMVPQGQVRHVIRRRLHAQPRAPGCYFKGFPILLPAQWCFFPHCHSRRQIPELRQDTECLFYRGFIEVLSHGTALPKPINSSAVDSQDSSVAMLSCATPGGYYECTTHMTPSYQFDKHPEPFYLSLFFFLRLDNPSDSLFVVCCTAPLENVLMQ